MELNESCRKYLTNYYLLEETRREAQRYLEEVTGRLYALVDERLKSNSVVVIEKYMQAGGGSIWFTLTVPQDAPQSDRTKDWKYAIVYNDAMRNQELTVPINGMIYGFTAQKNSAQIQQVKDRAAILRQENPYRKATEVDLLEGSVDEVASRLADVFESYYDDYVRIVQSLSEEANG